jgi:hypothetical protein
VEFDGVVVTLAVGLWLVEACPLPADKETYTMPAPSRMITMAARKIEGPAIPRARPNSVNQIQTPESFIG